MLMESKYLLYIGLIFLATGILLRAIDQLEYLGLFLITIGAICKLIYIVTKIKSGEYKPGIELYGLGLGLFLFFIGLYFLDSGHLFLNPVYFIVLGITLKTIFIIRFIQIIRGARKN